MAIIQKQFWFKTYKQMKTILRPFSVFYRFQYLYIEDIRVVNDSYFH